MKTRTKRDTVNVRIPRVLWEQVCVLADLNFRSAARELEAGIERHVRNFEEVVPQLREIKRRALEVNHATND